VNRRLAGFQARRALLQARAAEQRDEIARLAGEMTPPVFIVEWGLRAFRLVRSGPVVVGGALVAVQIVRRGHPIR
jgi:hypothetical protein